MDRWQTHGSLVTPVQREGDSGHQTGMRSTKLTSTVSSSSLRTTRGMPADSSTSLLICQPASQPARSPPTAGRTLLALMRNTLHLFTFSNHENGRAREKATKKRGENHDGRSLHCKRKPFQRTTKSTAPTKTQQTTCSGNSGKDSPPPPLQLFKPSASCSSGPTRRRAARRAFLEPFVWRASERASASCTRRAERQQRQK